MYMRASVIAALLLASVTAATAHAAVTLRSAEMSGVTSSPYFAPGQPPFSSSTPYGPIPFPNNARTSPASAPAAPSTWP